MSVFNLLLNVIAIVNCGKTYYIHIYIYIHYILDVLIILLIFQILFKVKDQIST